MGLALTPDPHQIDGARWLSGKKHALLADEPRVGKTGTLIMAADDVMADTVLTITTASGLPVWARGWRDWSAFGRPLQAVGPHFRIAKATALVTVSWNMLWRPEIRGELLKRKWDLIIADEAHKAKNYDNTTTQSLYGVLHDDGRELLASAALFHKAERVWAATGTPIPHDPADLYPMMRALCPERLRADAARGWPDVTRYEDFRDRYCHWRPKKLSPWRTIIVIMGGKREDELNARLKGFWLLRTQAEVGILQPVYETFPLGVSDKMLKAANGDLKADAILSAARQGDTRSLDMHLGPLRRITGEMKARAVIDAVHDELDGGLDKIVLAYWHQDVGRILKEGLSKYGVTGIDGATSPKNRDANVEAFQSGRCRVFLAQIEAAGEAIDLSAAAELWFVETVFQPKAMKQMSLRVTNRNQHRRPIVRVCVLEGSIDEALQEILLRLWSTIREVLK